ncbi:MAG: ABC transporter ATP-binding protein/permease [Lachnospiraceae bacterium]|nr:ABC transporter ATP-binding protein/permease [Lachnospiraceae bacterium]
MDKQNKYTIRQNFMYCINATKKAYPRLLIYCACIIFIDCLIPVISAFLPKIMIEEIMGESGTIRLLTVTAGLTVILAVFSGLQKYLSQLIYWNKFKMNAYFLRMVVRKGLKTDYRNQENEHFRKLQNESFESCNGNFSHYAMIFDTGVQFFSNLLGFATFMGILISLSPWIIVFIIGTTLIGYLLNLRVNKWVAANTEEKAGYEQTLQYVISVSDDVRAAKDIRLYNMSVWLNDIYEKHLKGLLGWYRTYTAKLFGVSAADGMITLFREGITYLVLLKMALAGSISVAEFVLYFNVVAGFSVWLGSLMGQISALERLNLSMNRFRAYLEYPEKYLREGGAKVENLEDPGKIELKNVSFRYNEDGEDVLKNIDLSIDPGEHIAVVGLNGAGKTTLIKLICGLTEPTAGEVLYNGRDVREYNREEYYRLFGAVFQEHSILPTTIEEIVSEETGDNIDVKNVEECLKKAGLYEKTASFKDGLKTRYDRSFRDDGVGLSGGEIQKLLLARALYRKSPLILLDEPTAALDPVSENRLYETYNSVMAGKTTVFISHRLASTRFCNRIILIEDGMIVEEGTHKELLELKGRYYELFETQAKYYRSGQGEEGPGSGSEPTSDIKEVRDEY